MTHTAPPVPVVVPPLPASASHAVGEHVAVRLGSQHTGDRLSITEYHAGPGVGPGLHVHTLEDETFYVLQGEVTFFVNGARHTVGPGGVVFGPRGVPHTFKNCTDRPASMLLIVTPPANFEAFYAKLLQPAPGGGPPPLPLLLERIARHAPEHGISMLGPNPL